MLIAALAVLCALLTLALLVQRPASWPALAVLVVLRFPVSAAALDRQVGGWRQL